MDTAIKVVGSTDTSFTLGGYGVVYGGADLEGETFTPQTDFWLDRLSATPPVLYQHGQDRRLKSHTLGRARVEAQDAGLWVETQIALADEYAEAIRELAEKGKLGWSSGAVGHLTARSGKTITVWPIAEFSLTPTPAEPRTLGVHELRSLAETEPNVKALLPEAGEEPAVGATGGAVKAETTIVSVVTREDPKMEEEVKATPQLDVAAIVEMAVSKAIAQLREQPAVEKAFNVAPEGKDHPETKDFGDWCVAVMRQDTKRLSSVYQSYKAALSEETGTVGGYLVPPEFSQQIMRVALDTAIVRPRATIIPMGGREFNMPVLNYSGTTADQPHMLGGVVATWTEEAGAKTETEPTFETLKLMYHELSGYCVASNMLRQDAGPALAQLLTQLFGEAISWYEDIAFLQGTGSGQPLGIFKGGAILAEVAATHTLVYSDVTSMMAMFKPRTPNGGTWVIHPGIYQHLLEMTDGTTTGLVWQPNARDGVPNRFFGKEIIVSDRIPIAPAGTSASTLGGLLLADFSYYLIGARTGLQIDFSEHYKFVNNQGTWRFCEYVDGQPWLRTYYTCADGATTQSPFVTLKGA
ncbi:MAG: phage major capsid protein [Dehalococcoidia bacterium]|jgi:HK97 family phage major capsid protein|nr:phage major capsid protein [Dehalococcoidia bacterium]